MKARSINTGTTCLMFAAAIFLNSCQKEVVSPKSGNSAVSTNPIAASSTASDEFHNALFETKNGKNSGNLEKSGNSPCETVTLDTTNKPYTKTLDYGTTGCLGSDGKVRKGQIIITFDDVDVRVPNNTAICTFNNYSVDNTQVVGSINLHNNGFNNSNDLTFNETINVQSTVNGVTDSINGSVVYDWIAGENTNPFANLQFSITGSVTGSDHNGNQSSATITSPLIRNYKTPGCDYYIQGTVSIQVTGKPNEIIDYGNGACTGMERIIINGQSTVKPQ